MKIKIIVSVLIGGILGGAVTYYSTTGYRDSAQEIHSVEGFVILPSVINAQQSVIEELVSKSEFVVIGSLSIYATRIGHTGSIAISEVLYGNYKEGSIGFASEPIPLVSDQSRIWFIGPGGAIVSTKDHSSLPVVQKSSVIQAIQNRTNRPS